MLDKKEILAHWDKYVQSPAELAYSRGRRFPRHTIDALAGVLGLDRADEILDVGSGTGILGAHLGQWVQSPEQVQLIEPNENLREADVPESLKEDPGVNVDGARGESMPFDDNAFDVVLSHTLFNILGDDPAESILDEMKRVCRQGGQIIGMDAVAGASWFPGSVQLDDEQQDRRSEFFDIHREVHTELESGLYNSRENLPGWFRDQGFSTVETRGWFQPCRLSDDHWTDQQVNDLINLEYQANLDRIENLRRLLKETGRWEEEHGELFRDLAMDFQRLSHRRRKVFDSADETGWSGGASLVVLGTI